MEVPLDIIEIGQEVEEVKKQDRLGFTRKVLGIVAT